MKNEDLNIIVKVWAMVSSLAIILMLYLHSTYPGMSSTTTLKIYACILFVSILLMWIGIQYYPRKVDPLQ